MIQANLLTPEERTELSNQADAINEKIKGEVFILTTDTNNTVLEAAKTFRGLKNAKKPINNRIFFIGNTP
jgi:uncharacterized membrane protein YgcG